MLDTLPCPGCTTPLSPEATGCHICMRARTKQEIVRGYAKLREEKDQKRKRPFKILGAVLLLAAAGKVYLTYSGPIKAAGGAAIARATAWIDDMRDPKNYSGVKAAPAPEAAARPPVAPEGAARATLFNEPPPPSPPPPTPTPTEPLRANPISTPLPPPKRTAGNEERLVKGTVFDLATLKPVLGASVSFTRDGDEPQKAETDERGTYEAILPRTEGWTVAVFAEGYKRGQVLDLDPSYRTRDADERKKALESISEGDLMPASLDWNSKDKSVRLDLVVIPEYWSSIPVR